MACHSMSMTTEEIQALQSGAKTRMIYPIGEYTRKAERSCRFSPGDRVLVKEPWCEEFGEILYEADSEPLDHVNHSWRTASRMDTELARFVLNITGVGKKKLKEVTEQDALACGFTTRSRTAGHYRTARDAMMGHWHRAYDSEYQPPIHNPNVWVVDFKVTRL